MICHNVDETVEHFILLCSALAEVSKPMLDRLLGLPAVLLQVKIDSDALIQLTLDSSKVYIYS